MAELRTISCDVKGCSTKLTENAAGAGHPAWGKLLGVTLNGIDNPFLCPNHLSKVAIFIDNIDNEEAQ